MPRARVGRERCSYGDGPLCAMSTFTVSIGGTHMLLALAAIIGIAWLLGFTVFHVASGAIHILIVVALVVAVVHFVQGRRAPL